MTAAPHTITILSRPSQMFDLAKLCFGLCNTLDDFAKAKGVGLVLEIAPAAMSTFCGDPERLSVALSCLIRYAVGRARGGFVCVGLRVARKSGDLVIQVRDTGGKFDRAPTLDLLLARCVAQFLGGRVRRRYSAKRGAVTRLDLPYSATRNTQRLQLAWRARLQQAA